ncbi:MAG TPA: very short patch repair endonuclease [Flavobacteriaceae bacterium]|nr:very short patch repair endonuclease [Flavobacteriaceae bacterium]
MRYEDKKKIKVPRFNEESGFYTTKARSKHMSKICGTGNKLEIRFRKEFWKRGFRYRANVKNMIGKPDIVFNKYKTVVFIDGEFWHGHNWSEKREKIKSNRGFWIPKIERNMQRDREVNQALNEQGFTIFRFWEREVKKNFETCVEKVTEHLNSLTVKNAEKKRKPACR